MTFRTNQKNAKYLKSVGLLDQGLNLRYKRNVDQAIPAIADYKTNYLNDLEQDLQRRQVRSTPKFNANKLFTDDIYKNLSTPRERRLEARRIKNKFMSRPRRRRQRITIDDYTIDILIDTDQGTYNTRVVVTGVRSDEQMLTPGHEWDEHDLVVANLPWLNMRAMYGTITTTQARKHVRGPANAPAVGAELLENNDFAEEPQTVNSHAESGVINYHEFRERSCLVVQILNQLKESITTWRKRDSSCFESLEALYREITQMHDNEEAPETFAVSLSQCEPLFRRFDISCEVISRYELLYRFSCDKVPKGGRRKLRLIKIERHVVGCKDDKLFDAFTKDKEPVAIEDTKEFRVSDKWAFSPEFCEYVDSIESANQLLKKMETQQAKTTPKYLCANVHELAQELVNKNVIPDISKFDGSIRAIRVKVGEHYASVVENAEIQQDELTMPVQSTLKKQNVFGECLLKFQTQVIKQDFMSHYSDSALFDINNTFCAPRCGSMVDDIDENGQYSELDFNRFYTSIFMMFGSVPVFTLFDHFVPYVEGEQIDPYARYRIKVRHTNQILCENYDDIVFGFRLREIQTYQATQTPGMMTPNLEILSVMHPSHVKDCNFKALIKSVYDNKNLTDKNKKDIVNCLYGNTIRKSARRLKADLVKEVAPKSSNVKLEKTDYIVSLKQAKTQYSQGFYYIGTMVLEMARVRLHRVCGVLDKANIPCVGVRTDAVYINTHDLPKAKEMLGLAGFLNDPGNLTKQQSIGMLASSDKEFSKLPQSRVRCENKLTDAKFKELDELPVCLIEPLPKTELESENRETCDPDDAREVIGDRPFFISAVSGGCGKSFIVPTIKTNILFVSPFNRQKCEFAGFHDNVKGVCTVSSLFNLGMSKTDGLAVEKERRNLVGALSKRLTTDIMHIHFDEFMMYSTEQQLAVLKLVKNNANFTYSGCGDSFQNKPIGAEFNKKLNYDDLIECRIAQIFQVQIYLKYNKRIKDPIKAKQMEDLSIFVKENKDVSVKTVINKFKLSCSSYADLKPESLVGTSHIAYTNKTCEKVSLAKHEQINNNSDMYDLERNDLWLGKRRLHLDGITISPNEIYKIRQVNKNDFGDILTIEVLTQQDKKITLTLTQFKEHMKSIHCATCHSYQGLSVPEEKLNIYEYNAFLVDLRWFYTAITRSKGSLDDITCVSM